jgi:hypothetical protein
MPCSNCKQCGHNVRTCPSKVTLVPYQTNLRAHLRALYYNRKSVWSLRRPVGYLKYTMGGSGIREGEISSQNPFKCRKHITVYGFPIYMDPFCAPKGHPLTGKSTPTFTYFKRPIGGYKINGSPGVFKFRGSAQDSLRMNSFMAYGDRVVFCTPLEVAQIRLAFSKIRAIENLDVDVLERLVECISTHACRSVSYAFEPILDEVREKLCLENLIKMC